MTLKRTDCFTIINSMLTDELVIVNSAGTTQEWNSVVQKDSHLFVQLGLATPIGLGLALALRNRKIVVLDGDGSLLLSMGVLPSLAQFRPSNLVIIIFDNESYEVIGGLPTGTAFGLDLAAVAKGCGIENAFTIRDKVSLKEKLAQCLGSDGLSFLVLKTDKSEFHFQKRTIDGMENKYRFVRYIEKIEGKQILSHPLVYREKGL